MFTHSGVDTLNPQSAKFALFRTTITIGITQSLFDFLNRDAEIGAGTTAIALGELDDFLVTGVTGDASFGTSPR